MKTHGISGLKTLDYSKTVQFDKDEYKSIEDLISSKNVTHVHLQWYVIGSEITFDRMSSGEEYTQCGCYSAIDEEYSYTGRTDDPKFRKWLSDYDFGEDYLDRAKIYDLGNGKRILLSLVENDNNDGYVDDEPVPANTTDLDIQGDIIRIDGEDYYV